MSKGGAVGQWTTKGPQAKVSHLICNLVAPVFFSFVIQSKFYSAGFKPPIFTSHTHTDTPAWHMVEQVGNCQGCETKDLKKKKRKKGYRWGSCGGGHQILYVSTNTTGYKYSQCKCYSNESECPLWLLNLLLCIRPTECYCYCSWFRWSSFSGFDKMNDSND